MKKKLLVSSLFVFAIGLTACAQNIITKEIKTADFSSIKSQGSADVTYNQTPNETKIEIRGSENIIEWVDIRSVNGQLVVGFKKGRVPSYKTLEIFVSNPEINEISINGSGDISIPYGLKTQKTVKCSINGSGDIDGRNISCERLETSINGSGDIELDNITTKYCSANASGSGSINITGETQDAALYTTGSGDIEADELMSKVTIARCNGSGEIECYASEKLTAETRGSGEVKYKGSPKQVVTTSKKVRSIY